MSRAKGRRCSSSASAPTARRFRTRPTSASRRWVRPATSRSGRAPGATPPRRYHPGLDRYLVTWVADNDFPGLVDNELERYGQALDGDGAEVGSDDFRISTVTGPDGNDNAGARGPARRRRSPAERAWLHCLGRATTTVRRSPTASTRSTGGSSATTSTTTAIVASTDCDDRNPAIRHGIVDIADDGSRSGLRRRRRRQPRPRPRRREPPRRLQRRQPGRSVTARWTFPTTAIDQDCDGRRRRQPRPRPRRREPPRRLQRRATRRSVTRRRDIPGNAIDEDCSGSPAPFPTLTSGVLHNLGHQSAARRFTLVILQVTQQFPKGLKAKITCTGKRSARSSPRRSRSARCGAAPRARISSLSKKQREVPSRTNASRSGVGAQLQLADQPARPQEEQDPCQSALLCPSGYVEGAEALCLTCPNSSNDGPERLHLTVLRLTV